MKKIIVIIAIASLLVGLSFFQTWRVSSELNQQRTQIEREKEQVGQQIALIMLFQKAPSATLEGFTQVEKVYVAQINIPGSSSHLYALISGQWFDLGEGQMTAPSENRTDGK